MTRFLIKVVINAVAVYAAVALLSPHIMAQSNDYVAYLLLGLIFGLVNAILRPLAMLLTCPLILLTLGLGTLLVNTVMFLLTGWIGAQYGVGFTVENFGYAFLGALIVSVVSLVLNGIFNPKR